MTFECDNGNMSFRRGDFGWDGFYSVTPNYETGLGDIVADNNDTDFYFIVKKNLSDADNAAIINKKCTLDSELSIIIYELLPNETNLFEATESGNEYLFSVIAHSSTDGSTKVIIPADTEYFPTITVYPALDDES